MAYLLGGADRLRAAMADWYRVNAGGLVTTDGLAAHLKPGPASTSGRGGPGTCTAANLAVGRREEGSPQWEALVRTSASAPR